ncbi:MAG: hypothetical protein UT56_C0001G0084 [Candidatus Levybacteria bacterium GW2011_GWB1_39_7]|nr:MAG: hypothetical protein UT20_C0030G0008 [Candidatus Levybacteria bacterium GW2011_GWA1_39_11]KKR25353.1 MAG: hypothetical protein UT56_C0001G0084 [Candidatus Levybacteria bacterium GW2011_GWB1_39_7]KKR50400.1 MAG: hypothetical protein UT85_C0002G0008 [Candidatus Levybacteria bacterium GW2011_GWA2_40_16]
MLSLPNEGILQKKFRKNQEEKSKRTKKPIT